MGKHSPHIYPADYVDYWIRCTIFGCYKRYILCSHTNHMNPSHAVLGIFCCSSLIARIIALVRRPNQKVSAAPNSRDNMQRLTYLARFFAPTIAAAPTAYAPNRLLQLPLWPIANATRSYTKHPPKIQSLATLANPNPSPVTTLTAIVAGTSLK